MLAGLNKASLLRSKSTSPVVNDIALIPMINKNDTSSEISQIIKGHDFPTGGVIIGKDIIKQGYNKGRGSFKIRGEIEFEQKKNGRSVLVIKSIPYQINKSVLNERIAELVREKKIEGIRAVSYTHLTLPTKA